VLAKRGCDLHQERGNYRLWMPYFALGLVVTTDNSQARQVRSRIRYVLLYTEITAGRSSTINTGLRFASGRGNYSPMGALAW
jgi:hypothetical protein